VTGTSVFSGFSRSQLNIQSMGRSIRPSVWTVLDLVMAASVVVLLASVILRQGAAHPVVTAVRSMAARVGWREAYETGLLWGLVGAAAAAAVIGLALVLVTRAHRRAL
jgi:hypothetical protein